MAGKQQGIHGETEVSNPVGQRVTITGIRSFYRNNISKEVDKGLEKSSKNFQRQMEMQISFIQKYMESSGPNDLLILLALIYCV